MISQEGTTGGERVVESCPERADLEMDGVRLILGCYSGFGFKEYSARVGQELLARVCLRQGPTRIGGVCWKQVSTFNLAVWGGLICWLQLDGLVTDFLHLPPPPSPPNSFYIAPTLSPSQLYSFFFFNPLSLISTVLCV